MQGVPVVTDPLTDSARNVLLALALVVFVAQRASVLGSPLGWLDSDDAIVGIMASDVASDRGYVPYPVPAQGAGLRPGMPFYFYGQPYHGAALPIIAGLLFRGRPSRPNDLLWLTSTLAGLWASLFYYLVRRALGRDIAAIATILVVIGPPYLLERTVRPAGNYVEVLLLATGLLLARGKPFLAGVLLGLGLWSNPLSLLVAPAVLVPLRSVRLLSQVAMGFVIGGAPIWLACLRDGWYPLSWLIGQSGPPIGPLPPLRDAARGVFGRLLPTLVGAKGWLGEPPGITRLEGWTIGLLYLCGVGALAKASLSRAAFSRDGFLPASLLTVVLLGCLSVSLTRFRAVQVEPRYLVPLYLALPVGAAMVVSRLPSRLRWLLLATILVIHARGLACRLANGWYSHLRMARQVESLEGAGARFVATEYWIAYKISFASKERIVAAPTLGRGGERYPPFRRAVQKAGRCVTYMAKSDSATAKGLAAELDASQYNLLRGVYDSWVPRTCICEGELHRTSGTAGEGRHDEGAAPEAAKYDVSVLAGIP